MNPHDASGPDTPPFGRYAGDQQPIVPLPAVTPEPGPRFVAGPPLPGYTAADFPAPPGVAPLPPATTLTRPRRRSGLGGLIGAASLAAVIGAGAGVGSYAYVTGSEPPTSPVSVSTASASQSPTLDGTVSAAAAKIEPSVVTITVQGGGSGGVGTGVVLDTDGHILTNNHVVARARGSATITVVFDDGRTAEATIVGTSANNDLAVIKVDGVSGLTPAVFAASDSLQVGQTVVAAGAPLGLSESITSGIVSNTARPVRSGDDGDAVYLAVQTDAAINPGNSGGPLVDLNGQVVGINSSIASTGSSDGSQSGNIGIGFAIPADVATRVAGELVAEGRSATASMGVTVMGSDAELSTATGVPLQSVTPGGAADEAGLQAGDVVIRVADFPTSSADGLIAATRFHAPGTAVTVTYTRDGESRTAEVTLGSS